MFERGVGVLGLPIFKTQLLMEERALQNGWFSYVLCILVVTMFTVSSGTSPQWYHELTRLYFLLLTIFLIIFPVKY